MAVIAFGLFLLLPLVLLVASLGRTVVEMVRGDVTTPAPSDAPAVAVVPALRPASAPAGVAVLASEHVSRRRDAPHPVLGDHTPTAMTGASRPAVIPAPAPVFTPTAVARPIAPRAVDVAV